jgi:hypothetical protein
MEDAALLAEETSRDRDDAEYNGVQPDQRIEDEIRAQEAKPAMFFY